MIDIPKDLKAWFKTKFKRRNKRFKYNIHQHSDISKDKYSKAVVHIIVINLAVFLGLWICEFTPFYNAVAQHFIAPADMNSLSSRWWTILTSGFTHQDGIHFAMNMFGLFMIVEAIKSVLSNKQVWFVYVTAVLLGSIAGIAYANIVQSTDVLAISTLRGASAGVLGVLTVFVMCYPNMPIKLFFYPTTLKWLAYINLIASFAMVIFNFNGGGGAAHIAGMAFSWIYYTQLKKKNDLSKIIEPIYTFISFLGNIFTKKKRRSMVYESKYSAAFEDLVKKTIR
jgi:membrane associated rhomboid family serine protease